MAGNRAAKRDFRVLRRYLAGINVLAVFLAIIACQVAGGTVAGTIWAALQVCAVGMVGQWLIIRTWAAFDVVHGQKQALRKRS